MSSASSRPDYPMGEAPVFIEWYKKSEALPYTHCCHCGVEINDSNRTEVLIMCYVKIGIHRVRQCFQPLCAECNS
jgi:hypothetical protein